jgi:hypothetical protein
MFYSSRNPHSFSFAAVQTIERVIQLASELQNAHGQIPDGASAHRIFNIARNFPKQIPKSIHLPGRNDEQEVINPQDRRGRRCN